MRETTSNFYSNLRGEKISVENECKTCGKQFSYETFKNKKQLKLFCSRSCANSRKISFTEEVRSKISKSVSKTMKEKWERGEMQTNSFFSSKEEKRILEHLKAKFPLDEWTSGGALKISNELVSRDVYSNKLKICIEYDGVWHFRDIHGQLSSKQKKDFLLNEWCSENDWKIIRISESWWHENDKKLELIDLLINMESNRVFMGSEY
jgi:very-short-patch-repair endonuclease